MEYYKGEYIQRQIEERRRHPQRIYVMKDNDNNISVASHINKHASDCRKYYVIDEKHSILTAFIGELNEHLNEYELDFQNYYQYASTCDGKDADRILSKIISALQKLHPFFEKDKKNVSLYIQRQLIRHYGAELSLYIYELVRKHKDQPDAECLRAAVEKGAEDRFKHLLSPVLKWEGTLSGKECERLWGNFLASLETPFMDRTSEVIDKLIEKSKADSECIRPRNDAYILQDLFFLKNVLSGYTFEFSDILINAPALTAAQSYCLFLSRNEYLHIIDILEECKIMSKPDDIFWYLTADAGRENGKVIMDAEDIKFDGWTMDAYKKLYDLADIKEESKRKEQLAEIQSVLNKRIPVDADRVFHSEIYELYYFEQLIFMEILEMVKGKYFIRKCNYQGCDNYFASKRRNQVYCTNCAASRKAADKAYRDSQNSLEKILDRRYRHQYYLISTLEGKEKEKLKAELRQERTAVRQLINQYERESRLDDEAGFEVDLKKFKLLGEGALV